MLVARRANFVELNAMGAGGLRRFCGEDKNQFVIAKDVGRDFHRL
jgi:hypothetical protein